MGSQFSSQYKTFIDSPSLSSQFGQIMHPLHDGPILGVTSSTNSTVLPNKTLIATCGGDGNIGLLSTESSINKIENNTVRYLKGSKKPVTQACIVGNSLYSASRDLTIRQWNLETNKPINTINAAHDFNISSLAAADTSISIYSGSRDATVKGWDRHTSQRTCLFSAHRNIVTSLIISPDGSLLYQGAEDLCIRVWDTRVPSITAASSNPVIKIKEFVYFPLCLSLQDSGSKALLAAGCKGVDGTGGEVKLFDLRYPSTPIREFQGHQHDVTGCKFSSCFSDTLLSLSKDGTARLWDCARSTSTNEEVSNCECTSSVHSDKQFTCLAPLRESAAQFHAGSKETSFAGAIDGSLSAVHITGKGARTRFSSFEDFGVELEEVTPPIFKRCNDGELKRVTES